MEVSKVPPGPAGEHSGMKHPYVTNVNIPKRAYISVVKAVHRRPYDRGFSAGEREWRGRPRTTLVRGWVYSDM